MPTNLYGPNDNFDLETSHVLPAMIRKFHEAKHEVIQAKVEVEAKNEAKAKEQAKVEDKESSQPQPKPQPVVLWGSGSPRREFLHVDDLADACLFLMNLDEKKLSTVLHPPVSFINIGEGRDITIKELAELIKEIIGFAGKIKWDKTKPDGTPQKLLDVSRMNSLGWTPKIRLKDGIQKTYEWYIKNRNS
jgi:GDP-L-fucose synthase